MDKNINDFLDSITQQELEQWEEIPLIIMEDDVAQKRIQKMVKKKCHITHKKYIATVVTACLILLAVFVVEPVKAELERIFHFIPNIGVVESDVAYEVEIICGKLQKENVTVELKDCYVKEHFLLGTITITDTSTYVYDEKEFSEYDVPLGEEMSEKYGITWYHDGEQRKLFFLTGGASVRDNFRQIEKGLHQIIDKSENNYYEIGIDGFEQKLSFRLKETKAISDLKGMGTTVTQYGNSITANAEMTEQGVKIDYYAICSEEAKTIDQFEQNRYWFRCRPHFETIQPPNDMYLYYLKTKSGKFAKIINAKSFMENGGEAIFDATEEDFPATFYYTALSAKTEEVEFLDIPVPEVGQTIPLDNTINFQYGTIKVTSVSRKQQIDYTGVRRIGENGEYFDEKALMDKLTVEMNIQPNQTERMLYDADIKIVQGDFYGAYGSSSDTTQYNDVINRTIIFTFDIEDLEKEKSMKLQFSEPVYWIGKEYEIPVAIE